MATRVITIDMDDQSIRILQVLDNRVELWVTANLETDGAEDEGPQALAAQFRRLMRSSGIRGGDVIASVSGLFSVARTMNLPPMLQEDIFARVRDAIPNEELRLLWQIMRSDDTGQGLLVVGANQDQVDTQVRLLQTSGLTPRAMELKSVALARTVKDREAIIVNLEPAGVDLVLVTEGLPQVLRTIALPQTSEAEERADQVAQALVHTLAYYHSQNPRTPISLQVPVFLVGPLAEDPSVTRRIGERMENPVEPFAPALDYPPHMPIAQYAVNAGLALREVARVDEVEEGEHAPVPIRINLMPQRLSLLRLLRQRARPLAAVAVGLVLAGVLFQLNAGATQGVANLEADVDRIEVEVSSRRDDLLRLTQVESSITAFQNLTAPWGRVAVALETFQGILTPDILLSNVTVGTSEAEFSTTATNEDPVLAIEEAIAFVETFRADGRFGDVPYGVPTTAIKVSMSTASLDKQ